MNSVERAKEILERLNKGGYGQTNLMTMDMPAVVSATEEERLRAKEGNEALYPSEAHAQDVISLGRKIMMIDGGQYGVSPRIANKLAEYIERKEDTALDELEVMYTMFLKDFYKNIADAKKVNREMFASDEDFKMAQSYLNSKAKEYENKLHYVFRVIQTVKEHDEFDEENADEDAKNFNDQFDFSFLNTNYAQGYPTNFSSNLR